MINKNITKTLYNITKQYIKSENVNHQDAFLNILDVYSNKISDYVHRDLFLGKDFSIMVAKEQSERALRVISEYARKYGELR